jgi:hypothetical protein
MLKNLLKDRNYWHLLWNKFGQLISLSAFCLVILSGCSNHNKKKSDIEKFDTIFFDDFGIGSQGEYIANIIQLPPPVGLGFDWEVLPGGYLPVKWILSDELELTDPRKGFWVIPPDSGYMQQAGRSHNSVLFANTPIPAGTKHFDITFRQKREDNDPIMYLLGATEPILNKGFEFGYMTQVPGTDSTTVDAYVSGVLGESVIPDMALMHQWANHTIKVRGDSVSWFTEGILMASSVVPGKPKAGYFGIRQRYERNTKYDDVKIVVFK